MTRDEMVQTVFTSMVAAAYQRHVRGPHKTELAQMLEEAELVADTVFPRKPAKIDVTEVLPGQFTTDVPEFVKLVQAAREALDMLVVVPSAFPTRYKLEQALAPFKDIK